MVTWHEPTCISVAHCARIMFWSLALSLPTPLAFLTPLCWVPLKTPHFASSRPPAAGARSIQPRISGCRWIVGMGPPNPGAAGLHRPAGPAAQHYVQNEQTGGTEADRQGFRKEKCREALVPVVQYQPHFISLPSTTYPKARSGQLTCGRMYSS